MISGWKVDGTQAEQEPVGFNDRVRVVDDLLILLL